MREVFLHLLVQLLIDVSRCIGVLDEPDEVAGVLRVGIQREDGTKEHRPCQQEILDESVDQVVRLLGVNDCGGRNVIWI